MFEHLGIIYDANGNAINHRSVVKVLFNPFLRVFGITIATIFDVDECGKLMIIGLPAIIKHERRSIIFKNYILDKDCTVERKRIII